MKLKYEFEIVNIGDEITAVPVGDGAENLHCVVQLNEVAAEIMKLLKNDTTEDEVVDAIFNIYEVDRETLKNQVHEFLEKIDSEGILER